MNFKHRIYISKLLCRFLLRLLYSEEERICIHSAVQIVAENQRIPSLPINAKRGREYRRDEASFQAWSATGMKQSRVHFGVEIVYWLYKEHKPDLPRKHHYQIDLSD